MNDFLETAVEGARKAGELLRAHFGKEPSVFAMEKHDIKIDLDLQTQELITGFLLGRYPDHALYGEEGIAGNPSSPHQWIVDPIDGTVNYFYGIPHFCISIALRHQEEMIAGVIYDPMRDELWQTRKGGESLLNGKPVRVSRRTKLSETMLSVGFSKKIDTIDSGLPLFEKMVYRARKCRLMGSAALNLAYVSCGRLDAYIEQSLGLWDVAAGILLVENAGGKVKLARRTDEKDKYSVIASSGNVNLELEEKS